MEFFAPRQPITDLDISPAGLGKQSIMIFTAVGYAGELTLEPREAKRILDILTMTEPSVDLTDGEVTFYGNYSGPLIGDDYRRYHTEDFE